MLDPTTQTRRLFLNNHGINQMHMWKPVVDIPKANKLWIAQYGSLKAGPFNTGGCDAGPYTTTGTYSCSCLWPRSFVCTGPTPCQAALICKRWPPSGGCYLLLQVPIRRLAVAILSQTSGEEPAPSKRQTSIITDTDNIYLCFHISSSDNHITLVCSYCTVLVLRLNAQSVGAGSCGSPPKRTAAPVDHSLEGTVCPRTTSPLAWSPSL